MVQVVVPSMLAAQAEGQRSFDIEAETVGDALDALPVADLLFNERGELNRHLNVYVDGTDARERGGLDGPLAGSREIRVVAMVSGGERARRRRASGCCQGDSAAQLGKGTAVLVGRSGECARLDRLLADAKTGPS